MTRPNVSPVLLTGATGFVGQQLYPLLADRGYRVLCATRNAKRAREQYPDREWIQVDVDRPSTVADALDRARSAYYLVHQMVGQADYAARERRAARRFRDAASARDIERIVYLGGVAPSGPPSTHLRSRLTTGRILRSGEASTIELRASMIIGAGSASWRIVRDLAARLPAMLLPAWTQTKTQPVWIGDVTDALVGALEIDEETSHWYDIPGPETLTVEEILRRTAAIFGNDPPGVRVPLLSPRISSWWLRFVTSADTYLARQLVEGLRHDLIAESDEFWDRIDHPDRLGFDEAARRSLEPPTNRSGRVIEEFVHQVAGRRG